MFYNSGGIYGSDSLQKDGTNVDFLAAVDVCHFPDEQRAQGCVVKDNDGATIMCAYKKTTISVDPCVEEALGVRWCSKMAKDPNQDNILIRTDVLTRAKMAMIRTDTL